MSLVIKLILIICKNKVSHIIETGTVIFSLLPRAHDSIILPHDKVIRPDDSNEKKIYTFLLIVQ